MSGERGIEINYYIQAGDFGISDNCLIGQEGTGLYGSQGIMITVPATSDVTLTGNTVTGWGTGIYITSETVRRTPLQPHLYNYEWGMSCIFGAFDARYNYWGRKAGPATRS